MGWFRRSGEGVGKGAKGWFEGVKPKDELAKDGKVPDGDTIGQTPKQGGSGTLTEAPRGGEPKEGAEIPLPGDKGDKESASGDESPVASGADEDNKDKPQS